MSLTPEERRGIYEEEKARIEAQQQLQTATDRPTSKGSTAWSRPIVSIQTIAVLAIIAAAIGALWWYGGTATMSLENRSYGHSLFYVDGTQACDAPAETQCVVRLSSWKTHTIRASTSFMGQTFETPTVSLYPHRDARYLFVSCGATGVPRQNCGLFAPGATPPVY